MIRLMLLVLIYSFRQNCSDAIRSSFFSSFLVLAASLFHSPTATLFFFPLLSAVLVDYHSSACWRWEEGAVAPALTEGQVTSGFEFADDAIDFVYFIAASHTMALGLTHTRTEMGTRRYIWG
jgi:hypothetical protein